MHYLSIDLETGGLDPKMNDILEIGLVAADTSGTGGPSLRILMQYRDGLTNYRLSPFAAKMNEKLLYELANRSINDLRSPTEAADEIRSFVVTNGLRTPDDKVVLAGKNVAGFDLPFLRENLSPLFDRVKFHHRILDPMPMFVRNSDPVPPDLKECCKRAGIDLANRKLHTAVDDAHLVVELIQRGIEARGLDGK